MIFHGSQSLAVHQGVMQAGGAGGSLWKVLCRAPAGCYLGVGVDSELPDVPFIFF